MAQNCAVLSTLNGRGQRGFCNGSRGPLTYRVRGRTWQAADFKVNCVAEKRFDAAEYA